MEEVVPDEEEQCRLYHYAFSLTTGQITSQYALSAVPFEFPTLHPRLEMQAARYIYGCSTTITSFGAALGKATKINALVKMDTMSLIEKGETLLKQGKMQTVTGCVDRRSVMEIWKSKDEADLIRVFHCPEGWFVQEPQFVPRADATSEDDGFLLTYAFDESQLDSDGEVPLDDDPVHRAKSELWIIDAKDMTTIIGRVKLPQRVPYGLHGSFFPEEEIRNQRPVETMRTVKTNTVQTNAIWREMREALEKMLS